MHGFVKPSTDLKQVRQDSSETTGSNPQRLTVINPQNIQFALQGTLIAPLTDEQGQPVNSKIDKRHTMFAGDIKKHINDQNSLNAAGSTGSGH